MVLGSQALVTGGRRSRRGGESSCPSTRNHRDDCQWSNCPITRRYPSPWCPRNRPFLQLSGPNEHRRARITKEPDWQFGPNPCRALSRKVSISCSLSPVDSRCRLRPFSTRRQRYAKTRICSIWQCPTTHAQEDVEDRERKGVLGFAGTAKEATYHASRGG